MNLSPDDTIWTSDGISGIVVGIDHDIISVLWFNFMHSVSKVHRKDIFSYRKFQ